jgi:acyl-CoA thioesterase FadM
MYPFVRMLKEIVLHRGGAPLAITDWHLSHHICWPWDLDIFAELNNGRTLTLYDLGRVPMAIRTGLGQVLKREGWGMAVAGASVRYRRRVRAFDRFTMASRVIGWDARFIYMDQSMWRNGQCLSQILLRSAVTDRAGIVAPARVLAALGHPVESPALPGWVTDWIAAEEARPWPPAAPAGLDTIG